MQSTSPSSEWNGALSGAVTPGLVAGLVRGLSCFDGLLIITGGRSTGHIYFRDARVVHASVENALGHAAFYELLSQESGTYQFRHGIGPEQQYDPFAS